MESLLRDNNDISEEIVELIDESDITGYGSNIDPPAQKVQSHG